ncbi:MAG: 4-hydroxybenzoate octaprenyltransferase [Alphaproteobacteria bacterium]|nr:4-hydroxybenzoate octaprenyltransferase [Alphaproteobacteria bacterium]
MDRQKETALAATLRDAPAGDATAGNWVDTVAPRPARPYLRLARLDRPIGAWLLLWPCFWSVALAAREAPTGWRWAVTGAGANGEGLPDPILLVLFLIGAFAMRAAGCVWNDIIDCDIDAQVARTATRPLASGAVTLRGAVMLLVALLLVGLAVLLSFDRFAIGLGFASMVIVALYPFAKRVTFWPQAVLGLAFSWGALMGWAAFTGEIGWAPLVLYAGCVAWVIGYDTIYALQDVEDDQLLGVRSTALKFGAHVKRWLAAFYAFAFVCICCAAWLAHVPTLPFAALAIAAGMHLAWQVADLRPNDPADALSKFRSNHTFGILVFAAIVAANMFGGFMMSR